MDTRIRSKPTVYAGTTFRSRLEARWAAFFDLVGWPYTYEPFDVDDWTPDFLVHGTTGFLVEVGPCMTLADYKAKSLKPSRFKPMPTLVLGVAPIAADGTWSKEVAGWIVNEFPDSGSAGPAFWDCCEIGELTVYGDDRTRPCDHGWTARKSWISNLPTLWAQAGSVVQWHPR